MLPAADSILTDLTIAENDFNLVKFDGFDEEELKCYQELNQKVKDNILKVLS